MNTDNGALEFDSYFNNERLIKSVNEAKKSVKDFTDSTVTEGEKIDDAFKITAENIRIQKDVIVQLEGQLNNLNIEISKVKPGSGQTILKQQAAEVTAELNAEKNALKMLQSQVEKTETAHSSYRSQLMALREEMIKMEGAGLRDSPEYRRLQVRAGELKDSIGDAQQQMKVLADDERVFKGVVSTISGVTGAFSAAQGAVGLFAGENENLNKIMLKVQSLMAITIGLQQVGEMLNKDSYFSVVILTKAKEMMAIAELKLASAFGISTVAAQVLMATLTLGLSIAITAIIVAISKLSSQTAAAKKEMNELIKSTADMAAKPVATVEQLALAWGKLGDNIKEKEKFIKDNADKFKELGVNVNGVNDAEQIFVKNKEKFIESLILRAKAMATTELASQKFKESIQKQLEADAAPKTIKMQEASAFGQMSTGQVYEVKNSKYEKLQKEADDLDKAGTDLFKKAAEFSEKEANIIKELGLSSDNITEGSIGAVEDSISRLKEKYKSATTDKERNKLLKDIKEQEKVLEKMDLLNVKKPSKDNSLKEANNKLIKDFEDNMQEEIRAANSVLDVMAIIEKKKSELKGDGSDVDKGKKEALDKAERDARIRATEETDKLLEDYATFLSAKLRLQQQYNEDMFLLQQRLNKATTPEEKATIQGAIGRRTEKYNKDSKLSGDSEYDTLVASYRNFEQKKQAINDEFEEKKRKAMQFNNQTLVDELTRQQADAISELVSGELMNSDDWKQLFGKLDRLTVDELLNLKDKIESQFANLELNPEDLSEIRDKLNDVTDQIQKKNPFKALGESLKKYKADQSGINLKELFSDVSASIALVKGSFDAVVQGLDKMGMKANESTKDVLDNISSIMQGAMDISTGNPLQVVQGSLMLMSSINDLAEGVIDGKLEKSIAKHAEAVAMLKKSYEELEKAIDNALGSDKYNKQKNIIDNLKKQQQEYIALIQAENKKNRHDGDKMVEYIEGIEATKVQIKEAIDSFREEILSTSVSSAAQDLGNAIFNAFAAGEDAAVAWGKKVDEVVGNVIKKMLIQKLVEQPVGQIINKYMAKWVDSDGNFLGFDAVMSTAMQMGDELAAIGPGLTALMSALPEDIKKYLFGTGKEDNATLSGQIKGASEETVNLLAGYANAIRLNQLEQIIVIRQQLFHLSEIAANTRYNKHLESIDEKIGALASDPLRSQGL